jgi:hypothetical protein
MPLTAFCPSQSKAVLSLKLPPEITDPKKEKFTCIDCGTDMRFISGPLKVKHFRHIRLPENCCYRPETEYHMKCKEFFFNHFNELGYKNVEVEYRGLGELRPDVYAESERGKFAVEIQNTYVTDYILDKTEQYSKLGIATLWITPKPKEIERGVFGYTQLFKLMRFFTGRAYYIENGKVYGVRFNRLQGLKTRATIATHELEAREKELRVWNTRRDDELLIGLFTDRTWWGVEQ